ncbi:unnamed protein product [Dovyalis caffra]|uniref:Uncharacterized protein n=1 Tax=Dovyalis caffra TaxID=77055 RepID=A0AAV1QY80_9ROSI|nr:unnamed protein product [Dovyalis caffra]
MATYIAPTAIVVEVLKEYNYDDWSACMKSYMLAEDLLDITESTDHQEGDQEVDSKASRKKNAAALHAIQISCAPHILSKIRHITSAKIAWDTLANLQASGDGSQSTRNESEAPDQERMKTLAGVVNQENTGSLLALCNYAHKGYCDAARNHLSQYPGAKTVKIKPYGETALHVAAYAGNLKFVEELVKLMSEEELEIQDNRGKTALFIAAAVGITEMAECLVRKNKNLVTIMDKFNRFPLVEACLANHKDMALYLYSVTPLIFLVKIMPRMDLISSNVLLVIECLVRDFTH